MLLATLFAIPLLAAAAPALSGGCQQLTPSFIGVVNNALADKSYKLIGEPKVTTAFKNAEVEPAAIIETLIKFSGLPATAHKCELQAFFSKGYGKLHGYAKLPTEIDVFHTDSSLVGTNDTIALTWNNSPQSTTSVGTVSVVLPKDGQIFPMFNNDVTAEAGKFDCPPNEVTFRVRVPEGTKKGGLEFRQESNPFGGWILNACDSA
ncbi:hypothetical protein K491DRAFT_714191 [Lophiostoma macrostomum CBS 122681]|uniref:Ubiquitin 3 binding protein But2 C-terminal domain-containing protein n=1 Tax=Lophiostoma macrostomum CBS 122681 TaxID=1314788 RepID=A0A6A6TEL9_9PLEO|nr:hypothetical protein K491DRAFT_714191 [Lophiostoma macrostomum CBS 122681]